MIAAGQGRPGPPAPAGRGQGPGGGEQQDNAECGLGGDDGDRPVPDDGVGGWEGAGAGQQSVGRIGRGHAACGQGHAQGQHQPADRVAGPAAGQHRPDRGRAHGRQYGANEGVEDELGQFGPAGLARQVIQPGDHGNAEHGQRPQRPRRHTRPPARSGGSGRKGRGHGPRRMDALRFLVTNTSLVGHRVSVAAVRLGSVTDARCLPDAWQPCSAASSTYT